MKLFKELKEFFDTQVKDGIFVEEEVKSPFYIWKGNGEEKNGMPQNGISVYNVDVYGNLTILIFLQMDL